MSDGAGINVTDVLHLANVGVAFGILFVRVISRG